MSSTSACSRPGSRDSRRAPHLRRLRAFDAAKEKANASPRSPSSLATSPKPRAPSPSCARCLETSRSIIKAKQAALGELLGDTDELVRNFRSSSSRRDVQPSSRASMGSSPRSSLPRRAGSRSSSRPRTSCPTTTRARSLRQIEKASARQDATRQASTRTRDSAGSVPRPARCASTRASAADCNAYDRN